MKKKGFTLVELMVVIAIVAILAAVALPIYSTFKQKARASTAIKGAMGTTQALQTWYDEEFDFSSVSINAIGGGGTLRGVKTINGAALAVNVGAGLPSIDGVQYAVGAGAGFIDITWAHSACNGTDCNGRLCMTCDASTDVCQIAIDVSNNDFGLDKGDSGICNTAIP